MKTQPRRHRKSSSLSVEHLETRALLSGNRVQTLTAIAPAADPGDTVDLAFDLGTIRTARSLEVTGLIDREGRDVDWYRLVLTTPAAVSLEVSHGVLGIYDSSAADSDDHLQPFANRLLSQAESTNDSHAEISRQLAAGTYFVAVSGVGNRYFHPAIADSGIAGASGDYRLEIDATALNAVGQSPAVLATDITPMVGRLSLSKPLNFEPTFRLNDSNGQEIPLSWSNYDSDTSEVQVAPSGLFAAGNYVVVISDMNGQERLTLPLAVSSDQSAAEDLTGNDTPETAISLGSLNANGLIQISGRIGDDPSYHWGDLTPGTSPANDVDLYHLVVTSSQPLGLQAEVFAGRIGSSLDAGLSLYYRDPSSGRLQFVAGNDDTYNPTQSTSGTVPLAFDAALAAGLIAGDYYIAVSDGRNTPSPAEFQEPGDAGISDPEVSHSGSLGYSVGDYVLNLQAIPIPEAPRVVSTSIAPRGVLTAPPTSLTVTFSSYLDLTEQAFFAFQRTSQSTLSGIYVEDSHGQKFFPRLTSFDPIHFSAEFLMLDRLADGDYQLHLSGAQGLRNIVGAPLVGNSESGDYVVSFNIHSDTQEAGELDLPARFQSEPVELLGVLFPLELQTGVSLSRSVVQAADRSKSDSYAFHVLQNQSYAIHLGQENFETVDLQLFDDAGNPIVTSSPDGGRTIVSQLSPGTYFLRVGDWPRAASGEISYTLDFNLLGISGNAPPLRSGPAPAVGLRLAGNIPEPSEGGGTITPGSGLGGAFPGRAAGGRSTDGSSTRSLFSALNSNRVSNLQTGEGPSGSDFEGGKPAINLSTSYRTLSADGSTSSTTLRLTRRLSSVRSGLTISGLSRLADGPVGGANAASIRTITGLTQSRQLTHLVQSALANQNDLAQKEGAQDESAESPAPRVTSHPTQTDTAQESDAEQRLDTADATEPVPTTETSLETAGEKSKSVTSIAPAEQSVTVLDDHALLELVLTEQLRNLEQESSVPDQLFAAGLGMAIVNSIICTDKTSAAPGLPTKSRRSSRREAGQRS